MNLKEKWAQYTAWQKNPYEVAPMSDEEHVCATCSTEYRGNFCPRCGQSAKVVPRMSIWKTFLLFLDVWGIGNRGMFRTLRDLIFRPGYLIVDYLRGRHGAYFPPFKLLFLLTTLSLLVDHGLNFRRENYSKDYTFNEQAIERLADDDKDVMVYDSLNKVISFYQDYPSISRIIYTLFLGLSLFVLFKKTKNVGRLSFHEFVVAMVYMVNMVSIYSVVLRLFGNNTMLNTLLIFLYVIPLKQMSGYSWWSTVLRFLGSFLIGILYLIIVFVLFTVLLAVIYTIQMGD